VALNHSSGTGNDSYSTGLLVLKRWVITECQIT
jgi:hypothetical protein